MKKYLAYQPIDYAKFAPSATPTEALYGLPLEVKYCKKCTISNQRPNSAVEFKHTKDSKKQTISTNTASAMPAAPPRKRPPSTGMPASSS
jgi:hypothetical protein